MSEHGELDSVGLYDSVPADVTAGGRAQLHICFMETLVLENWLTDTFAPSLTARPSLAPATSNSSSWRRTAKTTTAGIPMIAGASPVV